MSFNPKSGGCVCGQVRYELTASPITCYACHCTQCQTISGSGFSLSAIAEIANIRVLAGDVSESTFQINGSDRSRHYCSNCGTLVWFSSPLFPGIVAIKAGTFDDTSWFRPIAHLWVSSKMPSVEIGDNEIKYDGQPEMADLVALWQEASDA